MKNCLAVSLQLNIGLTLNPLRQSWSCTILISLRKRACVSSESCSVSYQRPAASSSGFTLVFKLKASILLGAASKPVHHLAIYLQNKSLLTGSLCSEDCHCLAETLSDLHCSRRLSLPNYASSCLFFHRC